MILVISTIGFLAAVAIYASVKGIIDKFCVPDNDLKLDICKYKKTNPTEECTICLEDYIPNDKIIFLTCHHYFHQKCLAKWFNYKLNCPTCRNKII